VGMVKCLDILCSVYSLCTGQLMLWPMLKLTWVVAVTCVPTTVEYCFFATVCTLTTQHNNDTGHIASVKVFNYELSHVSCQNMCPLSQILQSVCLKNSQMICTKQYHNYQRQSKVISITGVVR